MPLFIVQDETGIALIQGADELDAKLNLIDTVFCNAENLKVTEVPNISELPNSVFVIKDF